MTTNTKSTYFYKYNSNENEQVLAEHYAIVGLLFPNHCM